MIIAGLCAIICVSVLMFLAISFGNKVNLLKQKLDNDKIIITGSVYDYDTEVRTIKKQEYVYYADVNINKRCDCGNLLTLKLPDMRIDDIINYKCASCGKKYTYKFVIAHINKNCDYLYGVSE